MWIETEPQHILRSSSHFDDPTIFRESWVFWLVAKATAGGRGWRWTGGRERKKGTAAQSTELLIWPDVCRCQCKFFCLNCLNSVTVDLCVTWEEVNAEKSNGQRFCHCLEAKPKDMLLLSIISLVYLVKYDKLSGHDSFPKTSITIIQWFHVSRKVGKPNWDKLNYVIHTTNTFWKGRERDCSCSRMRAGSCSRCDWMPE